MVILILGSKSDLSWGKEVIKYLKELGLDYKMHISSAHKTPKFLLSIIEKYNRLDEPIVFISVAGRSNALGGFVDANSCYPVINCPPYSEKFAGLDILSSLRMPSGVAPLTVLEPEQAAISAAKILSLSDSSLKIKILNYQKSSEKIIMESNKSLK